MNAVEFEQAVSELAEQSFYRREFPFQFLAAFGYKDRSLKCSHSNESDAAKIT